jgi:hypothetical protein
MNNDYNMVESLNVLDEELLPCSQDPLTGFFPRCPLQHMQGRLWQPYGLRDNDRRVFGLFKICGK